MLRTITSIRRGARGLRMCSALAQDVLLCALVALALTPPPLRAQEIRVRVLNGRNGNPISKECLNVWTGTWRGAHMVAVTNKEGVAVLHVSDSEIQAEGGCPGWPTQASRRPDADGITVSGDRYVSCQEYGKITPGEPPTDPVTTMPSYPLKKILESGVSSSNTCGKFRTEARPGELVFYVRSRGFLEKMRQ
jgi:hypothetical protein